MKSIRLNLRIVPGFNAVASTRPDWSPHTGTPYYRTFHNVTSLWLFCVTAPSAAQLLPLPVFHEFGAHVLVQCITIDIFLPPSPCLMKVLSSQHVTCHKHAVRRISKFYKLGDLTGSVLQWVSAKITSLCSHHREEQRPSLCPLLGSAWKVCSNVSTVDHQIVLCVGLPCGCSGITKLWLYIVARTLPLLCVQTAGASLQFT